MLKLENVTVEYRLGDSVCRALNEVNIGIPEGQFVSIVGRSGSGKSTFLRIASGMEIPSGGIVFCGGKCLSDLSADELSEHRCRRIGFIFQSFMLEPEYDVYTNVEIPLMITGVDPKLRKEKIMRALSELGIAEKVDVPVKKLSGGERQRVCIARALINDPPVIFADEPCGNLDEENAAAVMKILRQLADNGKTVVLVTHDPEAAKMADRIIRLRDGKVVTDEIC